MTDTGLLSLTGRKQNQQHGSKQSLSPQPCCKQQHILYHDVWARAPVQTQQPEGFLGKCLPRSEAAPRGTAAQHSGCCRTNQSSASATATSDLQAGCRLAFSLAFRKCIRTLPKEHSCVGALKFNRLHIAFLRQRTRTGRFPHAHRQSTRRQVQHTPICFNTLMQPPTQSCQTENNNSNQSLCR